MARKTRKTAISGNDSTELVTARVFNSVAYVRLSVEDSGKNDNGQAIEAQRAMIEDFIASQPDMRLVGVFCDNGSSGVDFSRPDFERMMAEVAAKTVDCIVVKDLSRLGRNYIETGYYIEKTFPYLGVRFISIQDNFDTLKNVGGNDLIVGLRNLVNDMYVKDISKKVGSGMEALQRKGEFIGWRAPYGYLRSEEDPHKIVVDNETAPIVKLIFQWRAEGLGWHPICDNLNKMEVPTPSAIKYKRGDIKTATTKSAGLWQPQSVKIIAANPVYLGHMAQGKSRKSIYEGLATTNIAIEDWIIVKNTHEPIIEQDVYDAVQKVSKERRDYHDQIQGKYPTTENNFKGLLVCRDCGIKMARHKTVGRGNGKIYGPNYTFDCRTYNPHIGEKSCSKKTVNEKDLFEAVFQSLRVQIETAISLEQLLKQAKTKPGYRDEVTILEDRVAKETANVNRIATLRAALFESFNDKLLTEAEYRRMKQKYDTQAEDSHSELISLKAALSEYKENFSERNEWITAFKRHKADTVLTRATLLELIDRIEVYDYNVIEIHWKSDDTFKRIAEISEVMQ